MNMDNNLTQVWNLIIEINASETDGGSSQYGFPMITKEPDLSTFTEQDSDFDGFDKEWIDQRGSEETGGYYGWIALPLEGGFYFMFSFSG